MNATVMKILQSYQAQNGPQQWPFSTPSSPELQKKNVSYLNATVMQAFRGAQARDVLEHSPLSNPTFRHSSKIKWKLNDKDKIFLFGNRNFPHNDLRGRLKQRKTSTPPKLKHRRSRRKVDTTSNSTVDQCANNTFTIKYEDDYKVWNNFSITYQGEEYDYYEYRLTDDGLLVCDYMDDAIQQRWRDKIKKEKHLTFKHCNVSMVVNITYYKPKQQSFTSKDNGVYKGYFVICLEKLILSCNEFGKSKIRFRVQIGF